MRILIMIWNRCWMACLNLVQLSWPETELEVENNTNSSAVRDRPRGRGSSCY